MEPHKNTYTPVSIGKRGKIRPQGNTFVAHLKNNITYRNAQQLREQNPEHVSWSHPLMSFKNADGTVSEKPADKYRAIIGDKTKRVYSIMSNRYNPVQHSTILEAMAEASEDMGINVFGSISDKDGRMHSHGFFVAPEIDISEAKGMEHEDPFILGVRMYNSHNGQMGFGAEIFGIRKVCWNYNAFGYSLGKVGWKHSVKNDCIIDNFKNVIMRATDEVPTLADHIAKMNNEIATMDEATALLYGISLSSIQTGNITKNIKSLNPKVEDTKNMTIYDIYNSATAYISHRSAGGNMVDGTVDLAHKIEKLTYENPDDLITLGFKRIEKEREKAKKLEVNSLNTKVVMPKDW